uniref:BTB domain-containing protein n=1 Tax=Panagrellus redivivus TaxID=6233 RepID=A0A7E4VTJ8_PANRE
MSEDDVASIMIQEKDITVSSDRFCTQITHRIKRSTDDRSEASYEIIDRCIGTKVVNVIAMEDTYKFHDGCLKYISVELANRAKQSNDIIIDDCFDAFTVKTAFTYILSPKSVKIEDLDGGQRYKIIKFAARYGLPPRHMSKLIDRAIYAELVEYAWENENTYLMTLLPKLRISDVQIAEDFKSVDDKITYDFVRKYLEYEYLLNKCRRIKVCFYSLSLSVWSILWYLALKYDDKWW